MEHFFCCQYCLGRSSRSAGQTLQNRKLLISEAHYLLSTDSCLRRDRWRPKRAKTAGRPWPAGPGEAGHGGARAARWFDHLLGWVPGVRREGAFLLLSIRLGKVFIGPDRVQPIDQMVEPPCC